MNHFTPLVKGQPEWHIKYNEDLEALYNRMEQFAAENAALREELENKANRNEPVKWIDLSDHATSAVSAIAGVYGVNQIGLFECVFNITLHKPLTTTPVEIMHLPEGCYPRIGSRTKVCRLSTKLQEGGEEAWGFLRMDTQSGKVTAWTGASANPNLINIVADFVYMIEV